MKKLFRFMPYFSLLIVLAVALLLRNNSTGDLADICINVISDCIFIFIAYLFYELVKEKVIEKEKQYLDFYIKNKVSNDIFHTLYFFKKIIHGYNLDSNTIKNITKIIEYSKKDILMFINSQSYLGFQVFKNIDEVRNQFENALNDNLILKYLLHDKIINILKISNNLSKIEFLFKNEESYIRSFETAPEFKVLSGKDINSGNSNRKLLVKITNHLDRFVVYDSGDFDENKTELLLNKYILKKDCSENIAVLLFECLVLMKSWLPEIDHLSKNESRFIIIKNFFSQNTGVYTKNAMVYVADIIGDKD